jgi:hypothetical protein
MVRHGNTHRHRGWGTMMILICYFRLPPMKRIEARREAGLLVHEFGHRALTVIDGKIANRNGQAIDG